MRPPEEVARDLVRQWFAKADKDFNLASELVSENKPYPEAVGFHSQQAAEKYLKAFLVHHQVNFPKTHNIGQLLDLAASADQSLADSLRETTALNPYAIQTRYPDDQQEVTSEDAKAAVEMADKVRRAVLEALGLPEEE